jgi:hypothetical protein
MATKPTNKPRFATGAGADVTEPSSGKKDSGWINLEFPPHDQFNWLHELTYDWIFYWDAIITPVIDDLGVLKANTVGTLQISSSAVTADELAPNSVLRKNTKQGANNILNPSFRMGRHFWWEAGVATDYDTPGVDTDVGFTVPDVAQVQFFPDAASFALQGPFVRISGAGFKGILSERIYVNASEPLVLSGEWNADGVTGIVSAAIAAYDVAGVFLGYVDAINRSADTSWVHFETASTVTPANTVYVRILLMIFNGTVTNLYFRRLQLQEESGTATVYGDDAYVGQGVSVRYSRNTTQTLVTATTTIIDFDDKEYDDPGPDAVTTGASWKFTAKRYMKVHVDSGVIFTSAALVTPNTFQLSVYKNGAIHTVLELLTVQASTTFGPAISGSTDIELIEGDYIDIRARQVTGSNKDIFADATYNFITIHEIL